MTLIEVLVSLGLFSTFILVALQGVTILGRTQQRNFQRSLAANLAMVIAHYRATDMIQKALGNCAAITPVDVMTTDFITTGQYAFWNSMDARNPRATWHGMNMSTTSPGKTFTTTDPPGQGWVDECPFLEQLPNKFMAASTTFTTATNGIFVAHNRDPRVGPGNNLISGVTCVGGDQGVERADTAFNRIFRMSQSSSVPWSTYRDVVVTFSQPSSPPPGSAGPRGHYMMATFWSLPDAQWYHLRMWPFFSANDPVVLQFLGRFAILDSLEPAL